MSALTESNSVADAITDLDLSNLYSVIDKDNVHGLNLAVPEDAQAIIKPWDQREDTSKFADSGVDDQVIIHVPFAQNVRLKSIILKLGRGESTPQRLRIYANHPNIIDFEDVETTKPQVDMHLLTGEASATEYPLRVAAFTSITSVSVFLSHSVGEDTSRIFFMGFRGDTTSPRKDGTQKLEIPASNAADAPLVDRVTEKAAGQQTTAR
ncbi:hypothetical protein HGRIS_011707 [Hohenbuehelia grisea]|uniref:PITH domain-containing protein n=1 Tax=Hohenbuehelia grisea TaxID=104357 RepID=A0ABR3JWR2_9AGAR